MEIIEKYPDKSWDWKWISENPNITMEIIEKYPDNPWNWSYISENPNITMEIIEKYPDRTWNWEWISKNKFLYDKNVYNYSINIDIKKNKYKLYNILNEYLYKDIINLVCDFCYYN
jgi:hypothetical protein